MGAARGSSGIRTRDKRAPVLAGEASTAGCYHCLECGGSRDVMSGCAEWARSSNERGVSVLAGFLAPHSSRVAGDRYLTHSNAMRESNGNNAANRGLTSLKIGKSPKKWTHRSIWDTLGAHREDSLE